jgi:ribosome-binding factor A
MPSHRNLRVAEAIREVVATAILFEVADPRVRSVTVVRVEVTGDLRSATVFVSIRGSESERKRTLQGLVHACGFLQARVAARLQTRFTPALSFKHDDSVRKSAELSRLIDDAVASDRRGPDESALALATGPDEEDTVDTGDAQPVEVAEPQTS